MLRPGVDNFVRRARAAGASGIIIPDLTPGADEGLYQVAADAGCPAVPVVVPWISPERLNEVLAEPVEWVYVALRSGITGTLDGGGYEVNDLYIEDDTGDNVGLVGYLGSLGTIKNIGINTATDGVAGGLHVGVLAGYVNGGTVRGCYASGNVKGTGTRGNNYVGGLVGSLTNQGTLIGHAAVQVVSNDVSSAVAGGLAGYVKDSQVTGYAEGNVSGSNTTTGGLVGSSTGIVTGYATGDVDGGTAGGLVGQSTAGTVNGYATGDVTGSSEAGGLLGRIESGVSVTGYARGNLDGSGKGRVFGWSPNSETGFYSAASGESDGVSASTSNADSIDITKPGYGEDAFSQPATPGNIAFTFGTAVGEWTFITGRWPSINLPPEVGGSYKAENQPTN